MPNSGSTFFSSLASFLRDSTDTSLVNYWIPSELAERHGETERDGETELIRARIFVTFLYLMWFVTVPFVLINLLVDYHPEILLGIGLSWIPLVVAPGLLKFSRRLDYACHFACGVTIAAIFVTSYQYEPPVKPALPWLLLAPTYAALFASFGASVFWGVVSVASTFLLYLVVPGTDLSSLQGLTLQFFSSTVILLAYVTAILNFQEMLNQLLVERLQETKAKLRRQVIYDDLTDLPNRRLFRDRLEQAIRRVRRRDSSILVAFMDLDNFKEVNDTFGHDAGDQLLVEVAERLESVVREEDTVARLGGDEFVFIFGNDCGPSGAETVIGRIEGCFDTPFEIADSRLHLGTSVGGAHFESDMLSDLTDDEVADLLRRKADQAMYEAKSSQTSEWRVVSVEPGARTSRAGSDATSENLKDDSSLPG